MVEDLRRPAGAVCRRPHNPHKMKQLPWLVCRFCGLIYLHNKRTERAIRRGCWKYADEK